VFHHILTTMHEAVQGAGGRAQPDLQSAAIELSDRIHIIDRACSRPHGGPQQRGSTPSSRRAGRETAERADPPGRKNPQGRKDWHVKKKRINLF
jgi:hypothetical protein